MGGTALSFGQDLSIRIQFREVRRGNNLREGGSHEGLLYYGNGGWKEDLLGLIIRPYREIHSADRGMQFTMGWKCMVGVLHVY